MTDEITAVSEVNGCKSSVIDEQTTIEIPEEFVGQYASAKALYHKDEVDEAGFVLSSILEEIKEAPLLAAEEIDHLMANMDNAGLKNSMTETPCSSENSIRSESQFHKEAIKKDVNGNLKMHGKPPRADDNKGTILTKKGKDDENYENDCNDDRDDIVDDNEGHVGKPSGVDESQIDGNDQTEGEDRASSVQVGWECLECARVIYSRMPETKETQLQQAQVHFDLGNLFFETEQFADAVREFELCVTLRRKWEPYTREFAEALYQLGASFAHAKDDSSAKSHMQEAVTVINDLIHNLKGQNCARAKRTLHDLSITKEEIVTRIKNINSFEPHKANEEVVSDTFDKETVPSSVEVKVIPARKRKKLIPQKECEKKC